MNKQYNILGGIKTDFFIHVNNNLEASQDQLFLL